MTEHVLPEPTDPSREPPAPIAPDQSVDEAPIERFPSIILAGPGFLCLLFVLIAPTRSGSIIVTLLAALAASFFFGVIGARARSSNERTLAVLMAFLGPVLFCLSLMSSL